jgi:hypothetical protein
MNEHAIEMLTPLLGDQRAREICALVTMAEACAALGQQVQALGQQMPQVMPPPPGPRLVEHDANEEGGA